MKKFILFTLFGTILCSCSTSKVITTADITWMTSTGNVVRSWECAKIQSDIVDAGASVAVSNPIVNQGAFFEDVRGNIVSISGGMILLENVKQKSFNVSPYASSAEVSCKLNEIVESFYATEDELSNIEKEIKTTTNSSELSKLKAREKELKNQITMLRKAYFNETSSKIPDRK